MAAWLTRGVRWRGAGSSSSFLLLCHPPTAPLCSRAGVGAGVGVGSASPALSGLQDKPRTVEDLPRVSSLELLYRVVFQGYGSRMHELQLLEKQLYGSIYRDGMNAVCVNTAKLLEEVLRNDDIFPCRGDMSLWREYRDMRGYGYGPLTEEGEKWYDFRSVLNKRMLHPKDSAQYGDTLNSVITDFIRRLSFLRRRSPSGDLVSNLNNELYRFSLEATASILFETKLGCLEEEIPRSTQDFIDSVSRMFSNSLIVMLTPKWSRSLLPYWGRYISAWDGIFSFGTHLIDKKMASIQQRLDSDQEVEGEYLMYLLQSPELSIKDVYGSVTELLLAGVDTTSNALTWTLHLLSQHPQSQDRLSEEVSGVVPAGRIPSAVDVSHMPYLKAVVKEALRLYPVVPFNGRVLADKDVTIGGYQFSKKTAFTISHYAISHDEDIFPEPFTFRPERWLRDRHPRPNAFGSIPFGFGVRGCLGRRMAELQMYLVLSRVIRQFEVKPDPTMGELKSMTRTVLIPDKAVSLHFVDRGSDRAL